MFAGEEPLGALLSPTLPSFCLPFVLVTGTDLNIGTGGGGEEEWPGDSSPSHSDVHWSLALPQSVPNKFCCSAGVSGSIPGEEWPGNSSQSHPDVHR